MTADWEIKVSIVLMVVVLIWYAISLVRGKEGIASGSAQYDERQLVARGRAFHAGFFTLLIANGIGICGMVLLPDLVPAMAWPIGGCFLGVGVFSLVAIHEDAFVGMNQQIRSRCGKIAFVGGLFVFNALTGIVGKSSAWGLYIFELVEGGFLLLMAGLLLVHNRNAPKDEEEA
jgi:hypothetical protein